MLKLFVYGTLKWGCNNHIYIQNASLEGDAEVRGYKLYLSGNNVVPFMVYTGDADDIVMGEIYYINQYIKDKLDVLESGYQFRRINNEDLWTYCAFDRESARLATSLREFPKNNQGKYNYTPAFNHAAMRKYY